MVLFDIRLHHTGHANRLAKFPDKAMTDEWDNKKDILQDYLAPNNPVDRIILQNEFFGNTLHVKEFKERFFNPQGYLPVLQLFQKSIVTQDYFKNQTDKIGIKTFNKPIVVNRNPIYSIILSTLNEYLTVSIQCIINGSKFVLKKCANTSELLQR